MLHEIHSQMVPKHKQHTICIQDKSLFSFSGFSYLTGGEEYARKEISQHSGATAQVILRVQL